MRSRSVSQKQQYHSQNNYMEVKEIKRKRRDETKTSSYAKACISHPW